MDRCLLSVVLFSVLQFLAASACAENYSISGVVHDQVGAVVVGASVAVRQARTQSPLTAQTDGQGNFNIPVPAAGKYELKAAAAGFATYTAQIEVSAAEPVCNTSITLTVSGNSETVEVNAGAVAVDTLTTQLGATLNTRTMQAVPLNGRSFTDVLAVEPGVAAASSQPANAIVMSGVASTPPSGELDSGALSVSGQRETANSFRVNGADVQEDVNMGIAIVPTLGAIADLNVQTGSYAPEYGDASGGQIAVTTKSGSNQLHGSIFEYLRNTNLDARNYFSQARAAFHQNQFGATVGGPLRKDKVFFFADYQGTRLAQGVDTGLISVPSEAERSGDFSGETDALTGNVSGPHLATLLTQKLGYAVTAGEPYYTAGCNSSTQCVLPDAVIPQTAWSSAAQHLLHYIPQPNDGAGGFTTSAAEQQIRDDKGAARLDGDSRIGAISGYYFLDDYRVDNPYPTGEGGANVPGFDALNFGRAQLLVLSDTKTIGANTVNQARISYMRNAANVGVPQGGLGPSLGAQGFSGIATLDPKIQGVENTIFNDFTFGVDTTGLFQAENIFEASDDFSQVLGAHNLKFGLDVHSDQINNHPDVYFNGSFAFTGNETGLDFADYLLGVDSSFTQGDAQHFYNRNLLAGAYAQDCWRLKPSLTLNYGVRWDLLPFWREKYNQIQTLVPGEQSVVFLNAPAGIVFPGDRGVGGALAPARNTNFAPRVGIAWSPAFLGREKTSTRASWGQFYTPIEGLSAAIMSANPPYGYTYTSAVPTLFDNPWIAAADGSSLQSSSGTRFPLQTVPYGASKAHPVTSVDWTQFEPFTGIPAVSPGDVTPYAEDYMLSIERQFGAGTMLEVSYVGTQAHHLLTLIEANPGDPSLCLSLSQVSEVAPGSATCGPFGESGTYTRANGQVVNGTRSRFSSAFGSVSWQKTIGNSHDNALEASLRHQGRVLEYNIAYTWSQSIDQGSSLSDPVDPVDAAASRGLSAFDLTQNFVANYRYRLPVERALRAIGEPPQWLARGWQLSGLTRITTGFPVTLINNNDTSLLGTQPNGVNNNGVDQLNFTPGPLQLNANSGHGNAFDTSLFSVPALGNFGNSRRRFFHGPGSNDTDLALEKSTSLPEGRALEFRIEAFNLYNHSQFFGASAVQGNIGSANFGQIVSAAPPRLMQVSARLRW
jgi:hypothetical protein